MMIMPLKTAKAAINRQSCRGAVFLPEGEQVELGTGSSDFSNSREVSWAISSRKISPCQNVCE
jgi:hypothetical protein